MTSTERQFAMWSAVQYIETAGIEGDIVESGVWKGGSTMIAALALVGLESTDRDIWLFDLFQPVRGPGKKPTDKVPEHGSLEEVERNMASTGYPRERVHLVEGRVEETIPQADIPSISLLRIDTNYYESTKQEITTLWPLLEVGGVLIIDDYGMVPQCRRAIDEYFEDRNDRPFLSRVDSTGRVAIKLG